MPYRVGIGYDIHRLSEGRSLFIGGVNIPYIKGLLGHSDGDVLLHAICDALLGAISCGDIGEHFPDGDPKYHDISSSELLKAVAELVRQKSFRILNIDTVVVAQEPTLSPFKKSIQKSLAQMLDISEGSVGVKAKTNEGMGEIGSKQAIAAYCTVLIKAKGD